MRAAGIGVGLTAAAFADGSSAARTMGGPGGGLDGSWNLIEAAAVATLVLAVLGGLLHKSRRRWIGYARALEEKVARRTAALREDFHERQRVLRTLRQVNRDLRVLTECNRALVRATDETGLLDSVCRIVVDSGGYSTAWVAIAEYNAQRSVRVAAWAGHSGNTMDDVRVTWADEPLGRGPTGTAIRSGETVICQDARHDPLLAPWWDHAARHVHAAAAAFPLKSAGTTFGALTVYRSEPWSLNQEEIDLLNKLAEDLAYGIESLRARSIRAEAERAVQERLFLEARLSKLAATAPGVMYSFRQRPDGTMVMPYVSPMASEIFGLPGDNLHEDATPVFQRMHPTDLPRLFAAIAESARTLSPWRCEFRVLHPVKGEIWVEGRSSPEPEPDGGILWHGFLVDITDRRRAEETRLTLAHRTEAIIGALGEIVYDHNLVTGKIEWSGDTVECVGWTPDELGDNPSAWLEHMHADDRARVRDAVEKTTAALFSEEYRFSHKDGSQVWILDRGIISRDPDGRPLRIVGIMWNVTERKRAEETLRESEERFRQLAESIHEVFWLTDAVKNRIIYISPGYESIWQRSRQSLYEQPWRWLDAVYPEDRDQVREALARQASVGSYDVEFRIVRADGSIRWIRDRAFPVRNPRGEIYRVAGVAEDITDRIELESQLRQAQKMEAIGRLSGGIAHDFNNILGAILGNADLAAVELAEGHPALESLGEIQKASKRARNLVQQILAFARRQPEQRTMLSLAGIVRETLRLLRATMPSEVTLELVVGEDLPLVLANNTQVQQVLLNLGTNAWHALEGGAGRIQVMLEDVLVDAELARSHADLQPGRYARIAVTDTGKGMDAKVVERVFEPFFTTKPPGEGTGLGLSVVHGIMETHEGAVTVVSRPGHGSTFHLYFPAIADGRTSRSPAAPLPAEPGTKQLVLEGGLGSGFNTGSLEQSDMIAPAGAQSRSGSNIEVAALEK